MVCCFLSCHFFLSSSNISALLFALVISCTLFSCLLMFYWYGLACLAGLSGHVKTSFLCWLSAKMSDTKKTLIASISLKLTYMYLNYFCCSSFDFRLICGWTLCMTWFSGISRITALEERNIWLYYLSFTWVTLTIIILLSTTPFFNHTS